MWRSRNTVPVLLCLHSTATRGVVKILLMRFFPFPHRPRCNGLGRPRAFAVIIARTQYRISACTFYITLVYKCPAVFLPKRWFLFRSKFWNFWIYPITQRYNNKSVLKDLFYIWNRNYLKNENRILPIKTKIKVTVL